MLSRFIRYLVKAVTAEMRDESLGSPGAIAEKFVVAPFPKGPNDFYVEWRLWEEVPDEAAAKPARGWYKRTRQPTAPHYGQVFAGLVGPGEGVPVAEVVFTYQYYGPKKACVAELGRSEGTHHYLPFPATLRPTLLQAGWRELPAGARRVKAPQLDLFARLDQLDQLDRLDRMNA